MVRPGRVGRLHMAFIMIIWLAFVIGLPNSLAAADRSDPTVNWQLYRSELAKYKIAPSIFTPGDLIPDVDLRTNRVKLCQDDPRRATFISLSESFRVMGTALQYDFCTGLRYAEIYFDPHAVPREMGDLGPGRAFIGHQSALSGFLPARPRMLNNYYERSQANCANSVMLWYDATDTPAFVDIYKTGPYYQFLSSQTVELKAGDRLRFGDIVLIEEYSDQSNDWYLLHTAIFIDENILWSKLGMSYSNPWTFSSVKHELSTPQFRTKTLRFRFFHGKNGDAANQLDFLGGS